MSTKRIKGRVSLTCDINQPFMEEQMGYLDAEAMLEASRCLQCKHEPCVKGCVANLPIPQFIQAIKDGKIQEARMLIETKSNLSSICSRVCYYEKQCEGSCVRGIKGDAIAIGLLERYVSDHPFAHATQNGWTIVDSINSIHAKVAIVGSGPSGIACGKYLADLGYRVEIFEASALGGGVLRYGIPTYRLPESVVEAELQDVVNRGIVIHYKVEVGTTIQLEELIESFDAVYIASGVGTSHVLNIEGETFPQVISANDFLKYIHDETSHAQRDILAMVQGKRVRVIGGGNVAMDAARSAIRLKAKNVKIIYRRSLEELPARQEELHEALQEGVKLLPLLSPYKIIGTDNQVTHIICKETVLTSEEKDGRKGIVESDKKVRLKADLIVVAIGGGGASWIVGNKESIDINRSGFINVGLQQNTNHVKVFAGGDVVSGAQSVVHAMRAGRLAAESMHQFLQSKKG